MQEARALYVSKLRPNPRHHEHTAGTKNFSMGADFLWSATKLRVAFDDERLFCSHTDARILGMPVGFVGAAESKAALAHRRRVTTVLPAINAPPAAMSPSRSTMAPLISVQQIAGRVGVVRVRLVGEELVPGPEGARAERAAPQGVGRAGDRRPARGGPRSHSRPQEQAAPGLTPGCSSTSSG